MEQVGGNSSGYSGQNKQCPCLSMSFHVCPCLPKPVHVWPCLQAALYLSSIGDKSLSVLILSETRFQCQATRVGTLELDRISNYYLPIYSQIQQNVLITKFTSLNLFEMSSFRFWNMKFRLCSIYPQTTELNYYYFISRKLK